MERRVNKSVELNILAVEDDDISRALLGEMLRKTGHHFDLARDGS